MKVNRLEITNFRNIESEIFTPSKELTVISGKNGQGKTNLLEGVWLLTGSKSFRSSKDAELIEKNHDLSVLNASCEGFDKKSQIRITISSAEGEKKGRYAKVNGVDFKRATNLAGIFTAVVFAPPHLSLVRGSPEGRRKFIDAALCQLYPSYLSVIRRYNRLLLQKNALLKQRGQKKELITVFNEGLAQAGEEISERRKDFIRQIYPTAKQVYADISKNSESLELSYCPCFEKGKLFESLEKSFQREEAAGYCITGPHREDIDIILSGSDAKAFASQGQQRSCVLALKLAEAQQIKDITGEHPVMLLDDVLSELDEDRQQYLLTGVKGKQTIVTACDAAAFIKTDGAIYEMNGGRLQKRRD